jgi:hypothetical protein
MRLLCNDFDETDAAMAHMEWVFYVSKALDFFDTGTKRADACWPGFTAPLITLRDGWCSFQQYLSSLVNHGRGCRSCMYTTTRYATRASHAHFLVALRAFAILASITKTYLVFFLVRSVRVFVPMVAFKHR